jgi:hypothetical protein
LKEVFEPVTEQQRTCKVANSVLNTPMPGSAARNKRYPYPHWYPQRTNGMKNCLIQMGAPKWNGVLMGFKCLGDNPRIAGAESALALEANCEMDVGQAKNGG